MEPQVDQKVFADYNIFRHFIYQRKVNEVLLRYEDSLRNMFVVAAAGASDVAGSKGSGKHTYLSHIHIYEVWTYPAICTHVVGSKGSGLLDLQDWSLALAEPWTSGPG